MKLIFLIALLPILINAQTLTKLQWSYCPGTTSPGLSIYEIDIKPMPIIQPGEIDLSFRINLKRALRANIQTAMTINRIVSGLNLPIRCYLAQGTYVGSCTYDDLCSIIGTLIPTFNPTDCSPTLVQAGINCKCPFNLNAGDLEIEEKFEVPDAASSIFSFLSSGDFDVKLDTKDVNGAISCVNAKFAVKPK